ncbi:MAG TPA: acyltransferase family protein, partial [Flavitalea sp.]|nr:acyltransferase family protein [Flavitalea sp.]
NYRVLSLSAGGVLAFAEQRILKRKPLYFIGAAAVVMIIYYFIEQPGVFNALLNLILLTIVSTLIFLFALKCNSADSFLRNVFVNPVITFIGKISYGLYLYHFPILFFYGLTYNQIQSSPVHWHVIIMPVLLSFAIASFSYFLIEKHFLLFKRNLSRP